MFAEQITYEKLTPGHQEHTSWLVRPVFFNHPISSLLCTSLLWRPTLCHVLWTCSSYWDRHSPLQGSCAEWHHQVASVDLYFALYILLTSSVKRQRANLFGLLLRGIVGTAVLQHLRSELFQWNVVCLIDTCVKLTSAYHKPSSN